MQTITAGMNGSDGIVSGSLQVKILTTRTFPAGFEQILADQIEEIFENASGLGNQKDFFSVEVTGQATATAKWDDRAISG